MLRGGGCHTGVSGVAGKGGRGIDPRHKVSAGVGRGGDLLGIS